MSTDQLDRADTSGDQWGVWETECAICHTKIVIVAPVHAVEWGYADNDPRDEMFCTNCGGDPQGREIVEGAK